MRAVVQRVLEATCRVDGDTTGSIGRGLLVFLGIGDGDDVEDRDRMAHKLVGLRIFEDADGKMNRDVAAVEGGILVIPQFTLYGDVSRGLRPSFNEAAPPDRARDLYEQLVQVLKRDHSPVETGVFGAMMEIDARQDGPVTIWVRTDA